MKLVDSHCHLIRLNNYKIQEDILPVTVGFSHGSNVKTVAVAKKFGVPFVLGIAPQTAIKEELSHLGVWTDFIEQHIPSAIGEIGLDYHWAKNDSEKELEKRVYTSMIELAKKMDLPVVLHSRDAVSECLDLLNQNEFKNPIMMHFFSGDLAEAKRAVDMGGYISIPPLRSAERRKIIREIPLDRLLVESDAPYVGRTPDSIKDAVKYIAEVKGIDENAVALKTTENAKNFFKLDDLYV